MKILLVSPGTPDEIDNTIIRGIPYLFSKAFYAPHAVAAVAALTPPEHDVSIHDEYMRGPVQNILEGSRYDIIGISFTSNQLRRSLLIAECCKKLCPAATVVAGGIGVETLLYKSSENVDVIVHGEAEDTWPQFLEDFKKGSFKAVYKNYVKPDMTKVPPPRWELIAGDLTAYNSVSLQTTRGCPYDCSFCDVIYTYGRVPRSKTIEQILAEITKLQQLKVQMVFIADDNFTGDKKFVKTLLREMITLNNSFPTPLGFFTQLDITIANDDELLMLLADANFYTVMIGVESVNSESLKEMNKKQNIGISLSEAIRKIQSYGLVVLTHMIIGADSDDKTIFEKTAAFINDANIVFHICHPLAAPPGTRMWYDFKRQGRLISFANIETDDKMDIITNIIPRQMTRIELFEGLADYWDSVYNAPDFIKRAKALIKNLSYKPKVKQPTLKELWYLRKMLNKVFSFYLFRAGSMHRKAFFKILFSAGPKLAYLMPKIVYMYTFYLIDIRRSAYDARVAREHARWEMENPDKLIPEPPEIPVSARVREFAPSLVGAAYRQLREKVADRESLYHAVVAAMLDYNDRFGENMDAYDEYHEQQIISTCERVVASMGGNGNGSGNSLPENPPPGFTREIIDAMDNSMRYKNLIENKG